MSVSIALVAPSGVPFVVGGAEKLWWGLAQHVNRHTEAAMELIKLPSPERSFWEVVESYQRFAALRLDHFDAVISTKYPAWMVRHRHHVVYLQHTLRGLYDTWPAGWPTQPAALPGAAARALWQALARPGRPHDDELPELFGRLEALRTDPGLEPAARDALCAFPGPLIRAVVRRLDAIALAPGRVRRHLAISATVARREGYFPAGAEVTVLPHPSNLEGLEAGPGPADAPAGGYVFTASRLDGPKRVNLLVQAWRQARTEVPLWIAGDGPQRAAWEALAGGDPRIRFLGRLSDEALVRHYRGALFVPFVPYDEDMGLITLEAMQAGKPVLTVADAGGVREFVEDGVNGRVVACEPAALAAAAEALLADRPALAALGEAARRTAAAVSWARTAEGLLAAVHAARAAPGGPGGGRGHGTGAEAPGAPGGAGAGGGAMPWPDRGADRPGPAGAGAAADDEGWGDEGWGDGAGGGAGRDGDDGAPSGGAGNRETAALGSGSGAGSGSAAGTAGDRRGAGRGAGRGRLRLLVVNTFPAWPADGGGKKRLFHLSEGLARHARVRLLNLAPAGGAAERRVFGPGHEEVRVPASADFVAEEAVLMQALGKPVTDLAALLHGRRLDGWRAAFERLRAQADVVVCAHPYLAPVVRTAWDGPVWYDAYNVEADMKADVLDRPRRAAPWRPGVLPALDARAVLAAPAAARAEARAALADQVLAWVAAEEARLVQTADRVLAVSEDDRARFAALYGRPASRIELAPNGTALPADAWLDGARRAGLKRRLGLEGRALAVFVGSYHGPNLAAADALRALAPRCPGWTFLVAGSVCAHLLQEGAEALPPNLMALGVLEEPALRTLLHAADVGLNPMLSGSGTNLKMLDYAGHGALVLSTPVGARGLGLEPDVHHLQAELDGFAGILAGLAAEAPGPRPALRAAARARVEATSTWTAIAAQVMAGARTGPGAAPAPAPAGAPAAAAEPPADPPAEPPAVHPAAAAAPAAHPPAAAAPVAAPPAAAPPAAAAPAGAPPAAPVGAPVGTTATAATPPAGTPPAAGP